MTLIYSRATGAVKQNAAFTHHGALGGKRDDSARCPDGWICSDDFTDDDHLFSANAPTRSAQQFSAALALSGNGLVFQKDVDGTWQFARSNPPAGATGPLDAGTVILIETGPRSIAEGMA